MPKVKVDAEGAAAQHAAAAAKDSLNAAAHDAAAAALDAAASIKNTVKDYFPTGKTTKEKEVVEEHHHNVMEGIAEKLGEKLGMGGEKKKMGIGEKFSETFEGMTGKFDGVTDKLGEMTDKFGMSEKLGMGHHHDKSHVLSFFAMPSMAIIIALTVVLLSALFFMRRRRMGIMMRPMRRLMQWIDTKRVSKSTVLICGPVDAGKTLLFHTLSGGKFQPTQTSMEENINTFKIHEKVLGDAKKDKLCNINFEFIDFPGHPSREFQMSKFIHHLQGVVILIDGSSGDSVNQGAKTLFSLMEKKGFINKKIPVLICANKIDLTDSQPLNAIRQKILDELNKLKESRPTMENIEKPDENLTMVGKSGERLGWDNLGFPVSFGQISAKQGNVIDVLDFLEGIQHH